MRLITAENIFKIEADNYTLTVAKDKPFAFLNDAHDARVAELFALSSVHPLAGRDDTTACGA